MNENVENLILAQLREMREETAAMRSEIERRFDGLESRLDAAAAKIDGVSMLLTVLAGHVHGLETRIENLEETRP